MNTDTWGLLASPPKDVVRIQRRLRARRLAKARARWQESDNATFFTTLATQSRDRKRYEVIRKYLLAYYDFGDQEMTDRCATALSNELRELDR